MGKARNLAAALTLMMAGIIPASASAQEDLAQQGLLVIYGALAANREGDVDRREQVFFSLPATTSQRFYVRVFDPEVFGEGDFTYGSTADSRTAFRVFGGNGAFSAADRPTPVADGVRANGVPGKAVPITRPGRLLKEAEFGNDRKTNGRWVNLTALRASQGEVIGDRAYFRIDVQGAGGNDGNGYSLGVSLARDRDRRPEGLEMFSYLPTVRWPAGQPATQLWFRPTTKGPFTVQNFDAANGTIAIVTDYDDLNVRVSGQNFWASGVVDTEETNLALSLMGGFETPNDVTLAIFDAAGDPVALRMPPRRAAVPPRPTANGAARPLADCRSVAFDASRSVGSPQLSYLWDFGDGNSADQAVIAYRYIQPGRYTARLRVIEAGTRPGRGAQLTVPVHVRNSPMAVAGANATIAPGELLEFDGTGSQASDSPIIRYGWSFGDGTEATGAKAQKSYDTPGQYRAVLRVEDDSANPCDFGVATREIVVNFPPVAEAGADRSGVVGGAVTLSGSASYDIDGAITQFSWNMGDGTVLEGETVTHVYQRPGLYRVTLRVSDDSGVANSLASDLAQVMVNAPPVPGFVGPPGAISVGEVATLDASASGDEDGQILSYVWDFGDGAAGEGQIVNYAWTQPGEFDVVLTVIDDSGTASALQSVAMRVLVDAAPVADAGPDQSVTASVVEFDGTGSTDADGRITSWEWDFGDGTTGNGQTTRHAYLRPGVYEVALVVRDDSGARLNSGYDKLMVAINSAPIADAGPPQTVAPGDEFVVSGRGSVDPDGEIADYLWTFPDGSTARGMRATHGFDTPGLYRIRLAVFDNFKGGAASDESEVLITVNAPPVAVAGADALIAPGDMLTFDAGLSFDPDGQLVSFRWEFDDLGMPLESTRVERAYVTPGVWSAQLVITDDSGVLNATAQDDRIIRVNSAPVAEAGPELVSDSLFVELDGSASGDADGDALSYLWDFGDGGAPVSGRMASYVYSGPGIFPITLRVDDGTGLSNATGTDVTTVTINARPVAIAGGNREICSGQPILFDASASVDPDDGLLAYNWEFGDGTGSDLVNPTKTYETPGTYPVSLRVRNNSGSSWGSDLDRIAVLVREGPIADAGADRTVYSNQNVRFDGSGSTDADGAVNAFAWSFGDGGSASGETPVYVFRNSGTYTVTLSITGDARGSCSPLDTDTATFTVLPAPVLSIIGPERLALGLETEFSLDLSRADDNASVGEWDFGDGTTARGDKVSHAYTQAGSYLVTLKTAATSGAGTLEVQRRVTVNAAPAPLIDAPRIVAVGQDIAFDASGSDDLDGAITAYEWDFGDGKTTTGVLGRHKFDTPGIYAVRLTVSDDAGVANSRSTVTFEVTVNGAPTAGLQTPPANCPAQNMAWSIPPRDGTDVSWLFGDGTTASGASVSHAFDRPGLFSVRVAMDDGAGLANSRRAEEVYQRVNAAPMALAGPDRIVCSGDSVAFDASRSVDPDGAITDWSWEFSDGVTLNGQNVARVFDAPADLSVRLLVRDNSGTQLCAVGTDTARILVNQPPLVDAGPDRTVPVGAAHDVVRFDATGASDPDGQGLRIGWDFGDGTTSTGAVVRHRFNAPGNYTVTLNARDATGLACGQASDTMIVTAVARE